MCGRYYIDSDMADEIEKVVHDIDQRIRQKHFLGDIFPTNAAPIIEKSEHGLKLDVCKWGYPLSQGKNLVKMQEQNLLWTNLLFKMESSITVF